MTGSLPPPPPNEVPDDPSARSVRAQLLATEHWSLLASRSTAQSEVLTRIQMHLTFVSATLVSLALVGQATDFADPFPTIACVLLVVALTVGVLTQVRVVNVANEDLMYVLGMNRLRGAYARLSPGLEEDLVTSPHDDLLGSQRTYYALAKPRVASQVLASSMVFSIAVNAALAGLLLGAIIVSAGGATVPAIIAGAALALVFALVSMLIGARGYFATWRDWTPRYPGPDAAPSPDA